MDWTKQAQDMMNAWTDAQRQMWSAWQNIFDPRPVDPVTRLFDQWREMMASPFQGWTGSDPVAKQVAEQVVASQAAMMRFLEMTTNAWAALAPQVDAGQDWGSALQAYMEQVRKQFAGSQAGMAKTAQDTGELWALYLGEMQQLSQRWLEPLQGGVWPGGQGPFQGTAAMELTNLYWDTFERTFGSLLESPSLGYARELNEKIARGFDSWLDFRRASADYQAKLGEVWAQAFEQLLREMANLAEQGNEVDSVRELLLLWGQVADRVFIETFRTDEYVEIQGQLLNAAMTYRLQQREIMEVYLRQIDLPTRSEVDEAHRNIYELRKEIKALKKEVAALQPKPTTRNRRSTKKTSPPDTDDTDAEQEA